MIEVKKVVTEHVMTSDGKELHEGDGILIKVGDDFIVTRFKGMVKGYFATTNLNGEEVKYRLSTIESCHKVSAFVCDMEGVQWTK